MIVIKDQKPVLVDEHNALEDYFNALLKEATERPEARPEAPPAAPAEPPPAERAPEISEDTVATASTALVVRPEEDESGLPAWVAGSFQVLLFEVGGLTLAVPLTELNGIQEWSEVTPMPGHSEWFLGLLEIRGNHVKIVDPYLMVVPESQRRSDTGTAKRHIVLIDDGRWGLVCDKVSKVITLSADDVRWRGSRTKRPWLLGTVIKQMCAVLDASEFARMLEEGS